jgi:hypothetical protein
MSSRDIKLGIDGDILLEDGDLALVGGVDSIAQHVLIRVRLFLGEWFLDESRGVPYLQRIFVKKARPGLVQSLLRNAIEGTPGVRAVTELSIAADARTRKAVATWRATVDAGEISGTSALGT